MTNLLSGTPLLSDVVENKYDPTTVAFIAQVEQKLLQNPTECQVIIWNHDTDHQHKIYLIRSLLHDFGVHNHTLQPLQDQGYFDGYNHIFALTPNADGGFDFKPMVEKALPAS